MVDLTGVRKVDERCRKETIRIGSGSRTCDRVTILPSGSGVSQGKSIEIGPRLKFKRGRNIRN